jgi:hypothetical protein
MLIHCSCFRLSQQTKLTAPVLPFLPPRSADIDGAVAFERAAGFGKRRLPALPAPTSALAAL